MVGNTKALFFPKKPTIHEILIRISPKFFLELVNEPTTHVNIYKVHSTLSKFLMEYMLIWKWILPVSASDKQDILLHSIKMYVTYTVELVQSDTEVFRHHVKIYGPKVFLLLTKIKPEYTGILYALIHFPGPLVSRIRQVPQYCCIRIGCTRSV